MKEILLKSNQYKESDEKLKKSEQVLIVFLLLLTFGSAMVGIDRLKLKDKSLCYVGMVRLECETSVDDIDSDSDYCDVIYQNGLLSLTKTMSCDDFVHLQEKEITAHHFTTANGVNLCFESDNPSIAEIDNQYHQLMAQVMMPVFNLSVGSAILMLAILVVYRFAGCFTIYEKCWFVSIMVLSVIFSVLFPEESANGVNGVVIMLLYLLDTFLNILCELLISKQSRFNFLVSVLVEITEIAICLVLVYRFATMASTLFFWLPIDIMSYINWSKHKDDDEDELTVVRRLKGYQEVLIIMGIILWTAGIGYLLSGLDIRTDFFGHNRSLATLMAYLDACASAVGVANGLFIFFRLREQWLAWYVCALLETIMNVLSGQYVLLILKLGYFTNTTYGYIKWSWYIKTHKDDNKTLF